MQKKVAHDLRYDLRTSFLAYSELKSFNQRYITNLVRKLKSVLWSKAMPISVQLYFFTALFACLVYQQTSVMLQMESYWNQNHIFTLTLKLHENKLTPYRLIHVEKLAVTHLVKISFLLWTSSSIEISFNIIVPSASRSRMSNLHKFYYQICT
jgi:hypothetical protein